MEVPGNASGVYIFECIASEASTANPLKKRAFRRPMDQVGRMRIGCHRFFTNANILSLLTSTTQERSATCSSTARMAARLSTTTFRYSQDHDHWKVLFCDHAFPQFYF